MSDAAFRFMEAAFRVQDALFPYIDRRARRFDIRPGMTVVDYGCGPGRYTQRFSRLVGPAGKVYAVDIHELAVEAVRGRAAREGWVNVEAVLARGYDTGLPAGTADRVCALDMFFYIQQPGEFLAEIARLLKPDGLLIIDDGHQRRSTTRRKLAGSGLFTIVEDTRDHLKCRQLRPR